MFKISGPMLLLLAAAASLAGQSQRDSGTFATGRYRNLFVENGHSQAEISAKIDAAFQQLFHGNPDTQTVYYDVGKNANGPLAYVSDINNKDVRSEGMSYSMMISVQMNKKAEFDALWNWSKTFMYNASPTHPAYGFFSWSMKTDGKPNSESPAPDGEEYWVMALYFASARWGDGTGIYNYRAEADRLLSDMKNRGVITGPTNRGPATGLAPDYANFDGTPVTSGFNKAAANFGPDAWRTAGNWAVDWSWWAADPREQQLSDRIQAFFESKGMETYGNRFTLDGTQTGNSHSTALVATNAVASLAATNPRATKFVEALWNAQIPVGQFRYYDGMWYMMGLLHCSGEFRVWTPKWAGRLQR